MIHAYRHGSRIGTFTIHLTPTHGWQVSMDGEPLDNGYGNAQAALDDLIGGHGTWPGTTDPSTLGLPEDIGNWAPLRRA